MRRSHSFWGVRRERQVAICRSSHCARELDRCARSCDCPRSAMLNAYARNESPFTKIGQRTVTVVVTKVARAAEDAFAIYWEELILETGARVRRERFTGVVSILFTSPSTARLISKNPLGLYVDAFTWEVDSIEGASRRSHA